MTPSPSLPCSLCGADGPAGSAWQARGDGAAQSKRSAAGQVQRDAGRRRARSSCGRRPALGGRRVLNLQAEARRRRRCRPGERGARGRRRGSTNPHRRQRLLGRRDGEAHARRPGAVRYRARRATGGHLDEAAEVSAATSIPLAGDESIESRADAERALAARAFGLAGIKLSKVGGPEAAIEIAEVLPSFLTSALDGPVGIAAAAQVAQTLDAAPRAKGTALAHGLATQRLFTSTIASVECEVRDGTLYPPDGPGPRRRDRRCLACRTPDLSDPWRLIRRIDG